MEVLSVNTCRVSRPPLPRIRVNRTFSLTGLSQLGSGWL